MNKFFFSIIAFLCCFIITNAQNRLTSQELKMLDQEIKQKHIYDQAKIARIDSLKKSAVSSTNSDIKHYDALLSLGTEYETFISDSALVYFERAHEVAILLGDSTKIIRARLGKVKVLAILGYFMEGVTTLTKVETDPIPKTLTSEWLNTGRQLYSYMSTFAKDNPQLTTTYRNKLNHYRDLQLTTLPESSPEHKLFLAEHYLANGQKNHAKLLFNEIIEEIPNNNNIYARAAHSLSTIKKSEGQDDVAAYYLTLSAISDIKCSVKETMALHDLSIYLYNQGDITRAYKYMISSFDDAVFCNARLRTAEVSRTIPLIDKVYQEKLQNQFRTLFYTNIIVGVLIVGLIAFIIIVLRQIKKVKTARQRLKEANNIKEEYIGRFLDLCSIYMDRLDNVNKFVIRKITAGQVEDLLKMAKSSKFTEGQHQEFYDNFDATFLHIYPTFIDEFNKLLHPNEQIILKEPGHLTTELRIFALLRMGVDDSNKIAGFLNYSVNTIYTYRNKIKNKAKNRDTFEEEVLKIGSLT